MTTEFLHEHHAHNDHSTFTQLSRELSRERIHELFAGMTQKSVTFTKLCSDGKNISFKLTADEASAFVDAWIFFQMSNASYEIAEQMRKEQEELKEAERRGKVWLEVDELTHSIPGIEIVARQGTEYNYDTGDYDDVTRWDVKLAVPHYGVTDLYNVDEVFNTVQETIKGYNLHLQECKDAEKTNWQRYGKEYTKNCKDFLAAHRAFVAEKEVVQAAQQ